VRPNYDQLASQLDADGPRVQVVRIADVEPRELEPLWPGILWVGKLTLIVGDPGLSKSTMVCDLVARVTKGLDWPCSGGKTIAGDVLMLSAEDDVADTLRPRLEAAGADLGGVHFLESIITADDGRAQRHSWPSLVEHIGVLTEWLRAHPGVRLLVVDPLAAYLTGADTHKQSEVRAVLGALSQMASRHRVAVLAVMHLNKGSGGNPLYRVSGSLAFVAAARAAYLIARDPQDRDHRLMLHLKNNLSRDERGFRYVVRTADNEAPYIEWDSERITQTAEEVLAADEEETPRERAASAKDREAADWLRKVLEHGRVEAASIYRRAEDEGISERALKRATRMLGVLKEPKGFRGIWHWALPPESSSPSTLCTPSNLSDSVRVLPSAYPVVRADGANGYPSVGQTRTHSDGLQSGEGCPTLGASPHSEGTA
jgi:putative DNA primase/helicase